ncbi:MAG TPA: alpha amylase C-terminal domain-containing protein, partial [Dermatophilaceae bacterium]|nr:alpha amylase C-terminal domain-containing protein [Dermatophilaceae bacterium]
CWQNGLLDEAKEQVRSAVANISLAHQLDPQLIGYPTEYHNPTTGEILPVAPFQYFESHDHGRFITQFGMEPLKDLLQLPYGDRDNYYKTQPYVVALYTAKGIPMLWHGQEFAENWSLPGGTDLGRTLYSRPLHWEYFYDTRGRGLLRLYRILGALRRQHRALRSRGAFFYFDDPAHRRDGIIAFRRDADATTTEPAETLIVILNFSDADVEAWIPWPAAGSWEEQIDKEVATPPPHVQVAHEHQWLPVRIPSHYGSVYLQL